MLDDKTYKTYASNLRDFFLDNITSTLKKPNDLLKHPFIDPGSIYTGNLWDWDSFWTTYGLMNILRDGNDEDRKALFLEHARGNIFNFLDLQLEDGYIPMMVTDDKTTLQSHYLIDKHKEGTILNMHKPVLCQHICLISRTQSDFSWTANMLEPLERYFACYKKYYFHEHSGLYLWADDVMIGVDNDPATFGRPRFSSANIFLNSFMVRDMLAMVSIAEMNKREDLAAYYKAEAQHLVSSINEECWDNRDKFYYTVDVDVKTRSYDWFHKGLGVFWKTLPIKIRSWSGFLPLLAGVADSSQADSLVRLHVRDKETFASSFGIRTLSRDEKMYDLSATNNPSNWLGPIWGVSNYAVFRGLMKYGFREDAERLGRQTVQLLGEDLKKSGTLHEYYIPETGEPVMNGGFINWNILVINMIDELEHHSSMDDLILSPR